MDQADTAGRALVLPILGPDHDRPAKVSSADICLEEYMEYAVDQIVRQTWCGRYNYQ